MCLSSHHFEGFWAISPTPSLPSSLSQLWNPPSRANSSHCSIRKPADRASRPKMHIRMNLAGWSMSANMTADLAVDAFRMGIGKRGHAPIVVHSDRGSQYASELFRAELELHDCIQSMSRRGNCWDNAVAESFFGSLKSELIYRNTYLTRIQACMDVFDYIEIFYNKRRLHSRLNYLTPEEFDLKCRKVA